MIGLMRVYTIFHLAICLPMRYLAGSTHQLAQYNWSCRSMGRVYDIIESKLCEIMEKPSLFLSHTFMMNIFKDLEQRRKAYFLNHSFVRYLHVFWVFEFGVWKSNLCSIFSG